MPSKKDSLAGKGTHRQLMAGLFKDSSAETRSLAGSHLTARRERMRTQYMADKARQADADDFPSTE